MEIMAHIVSQTEDARKHYIEDLAAMTDEQIFGQANGVARKAADFTYETAVVNRIVAQRLRGEEVTPGGDGWIVAPEGMTREDLVADFDSSCQSLIDEINKLGEAGATKMIKTRTGEQPAYKYAGFPAMHIMYHDAQLNFIQSLSGDMDVHWK
jgi:hypothetical protein